MNYHPTAAWSHFLEHIESATDGSLPAGIACNDGSDLVPALALTQHVGICNMPGVEHQNNILNQGRGFKYINGTCQGYSSRQWHPKWRFAGRRIIQIVVPTRLLYLARNIDEYDSGTLLHVLRTVFVW